MVDSGTRGKQRSSVSAVMFGERVAEPVDEHDVPGEPAVLDPRRMTRQPHRIRHLRAEPVECEPRDEVRRHRGEHVATVERPADRVSGSSATR